MHRSVSYPIQTLLFLYIHKLHKTIRSEVDQLYHKVKEESGWMTEWHLRSHLIVTLLLVVFS